MRNASEVDFICKLEFRNGRFRYTLNDFKTSRRTISGEAKNNGQSNEIHWQRVNSLKREYPDLPADTGNLSRRQRSKIYDYNEQLEFETALYHLEYGAVLDFINVLKNSVSNSFDADSSFEEEATVPEQVIERLDLSGFHGNLLARGNNVYIVEKGEPYEVAGAKELRKQIILDEYWHIVNHPEEAHFILKYEVDTRGSDKAILTISDFDGKSVFKKDAGSNESMSDNRGTAEFLYNRVLSGLPEKIEAGKTPSQFKVFER